MRKLMGLAFLSFSLLFIGQAYAYIIDTGAPVVIPSGGDSLGRGYSNNVLDYQWLAGRVYLNQSSTIRTIEAYFGYSPVPGDVTISVYGDNGWLNSSDLKFRNSFYQGQDFPGGWDGLLHENLQLGPGTYWVAFEIRDPSFYNSLLMNGYGQYGGGIPHPLGAYTFTNPYLYSQWQQNGYVGSEWQNGGANAFALRLGDQIVDNSTVPEPATLSLLGLGLIGLAFRRKKSN